jgi:hypothetical protein
VHTQNEYVGELFGPVVFHGPRVEYRPQAVLNGFGEHVVGDLVIADVEFHGIEVSSIIDVTRFRYDETT